MLTLSWFMGDLFPVERFLQMVILELAQVVADLSEFNELLPLSAVIAP